MSSFLAGLGSNAFGLLVEDGSLAIGIVATLGLAAAVAELGGRPDLGGWVLLAGLVGLLVANVYRAGIGAKRAVSGDGPPRPPGSLISPPPGRG